MPSSRVFVSETATKSDIDKNKQTKKFMHPYAKGYLISQKKNKKYMPSSRVFASVTAKKTEELNKV